MGELNWTDDGLGGFQATTDTGTYRVVFSAHVERDLERWVALHRPPQGRSLTPKDSEPVGNSKTVEGAQAKCETHYLAYLHRLDIARDLIRQYEAGDQ
jgi:hypothetical protein